jgi:hypothetical protein
MLTLPEDILALLASFAPLVSRRVWRYVPLVVVAALLAPGRRTVSTTWRTVGWGPVAHFQTYHRVVNRAVRSSRQASRILLGLLVTTCVPEGPLVLGIDETIERRRGAKIAAAGISRDPVRSSRRHARHSPQAPLDARLEGVVRRGHRQRVERQRDQPVGSHACDRPQVRPAEPSLKTAPCTVPCPSEKSHQTT